MKLLQTAGETTEPKVAYDYKSLAFLARAPASGGKKAAPVVVA
ncbi:MAG TPA: hypothetical protein VK757_04990 [Candidatus Acidoferrum sp.]|nr:hypothetical protein [Candidatus Acidoferrum sp.]